MRKFVRHGYYNFKYRIAYTAYSNCVCYIMEYFYDGIGMYISEYRSNTGKGIIYDCGAPIVYMVFKIYYLVNSSNKITACYKLNKN